MNIYQWKSQIRKFNDDFQSVKPQQEWDDNTEANLAKINRKNSIYHLNSIYSEKKENEKAVVIVGTSPCLEGDVEKLKNLDDKFVLVAVNSALKYLLSHNVTPQYVICLDSDYKDIYQHLDCDNKNITLLTTNVINPKVLQQWQGPVWFAPYYSIRKDLKPKIRYRLGKNIPSGGNSTTTALVIATIVWGAKIIIFVANEYCFDKKNYYVSKDIAKQESLPVVYPIQDVKGRQRHTVVGLYNYAIWTEKVCNDLSPPGFFIDTSFGILGMHFDNGIHSMELTEAIEKVKNAFETKAKIKKGEIAIKDLISESCSDKNNL